jgi:hypothetical protein
VSAAGAAGFQCRLDDARSYEPCGGSAAYDGLAHGEHVLRVRAVDALGLVGPEATHRWTVDIVGPSIVDVTGPGPVSLDSTLRFEFHADEESARLACRLDGWEWEWCTSPETYTGIGDGSHEVRFAAVDELGNIGPVTLRYVDVRTVPGAVTFTAGPADGAITAPRPEYSFEAPYATGYECRFDGGAWRSCAGAGHRPEVALPEGPHTLDVRGVGGTGKRGVAASRSFVVDASAPRVKIVTGRATPRRAVFRFALDGPTTGVDLECRLDRGRWSRCASPHVVKSPPPGWHTLRVRATDEQGNSSSASKRWRTKRRR